jgi:hypothetical protein
LNLYYSKPVYWVESRNPLSFRAAGWLAGWLVCVRELSPFRESHIIYKQLHVERTIEDV